VLILHQNLRNFVGTNTDRNDCYGRYLSSLRRGLPAGEFVAVAGFTEVLGGDLFHVCDALDLEYRGKVCCRITAVGQKKEFIGVGTSKSIVPLSWGRIIARSQKNGIRLFPDICPAGKENDWAHKLPEGLLDYQSIVYLVVRLRLRTVAIGFVHNIYSVNDNRSFVLQRLANAAALIQGRTGAQEVHICGDFNASRTQMPNRSRTQAVFPYFRGTTPSRNPPPDNPRSALLPQQEAAGARPGGTTMAGHLYDYAFSTRARGLEAWIDTGTMDFMTGGPIPGLEGKMSDHVASMLRI
jgi:hypothetical protein